MGDGCSSAAMQPSRPSAAEMETCAVLAKVSTRRRMLGYVISCFGLLLVLANPNPNTPTT